jgi:hydroxyethylthiazole kinase-like sugar kinase family protein
MDAMNAIDSKFFKEATKTRIEALADLCRNNRDSYKLECAVDAVVQGRPAFWHDNGWSNSAANIIIGRANLTGSLEEAFAAYTTDFNPSAAITIFWMLELTVPLNRLAAEEVVAIYSRLGHMRGVSELLDREAEVINSKLSRAA